YTGETLEGQKLSEKERMQMAVTGAIQAIVTLGAAVKVAGWATDIFNLPGVSVQKDLKSLGLRYLPSSGATTLERKILKEFAQEHGIEIAIRATDPLTALGTRIGSRLGLLAKMEEVEAKSIFGFLKDPKTGKWIRSDLDLAWVKKDGRLLNNEE